MKLMSRKNLSERARLERYPQQFGGVADSQPAVGAGMRLNTKHKAYRASQPTRGADLFPVP
jgi:hypothetical protein